MPVPQPDRIHPFATPTDLGRWLSRHHATEPELWIRIFKKASGTASVDAEQAIVEALCWGWIDGVRHGLDAQSFLQRYTRRRKTSRWSQKNCDTAERLIAEGRMQPAGLAEVQAARADGRWDAAYDGSANFALPPEFLAALATASEPAQAHFAGLNRQNLFAIYFRLVTVKRPETRTRKVAEFVAMMERGERFHG